MRALVAALLLSVGLLGMAPQSVAPSPTAPTRTAPTGNPDAKVWVNTHSGVYHCPGSRWYGNTKNGEYMTQRQAQDKGHRPAYGRACN